MSSLASSQSEIAGFRIASEPPEARGLPRDAVRLMVARPEGFTHLQFFDLPEILRPGDLLVVNTSATLPAAVDGVHAGGPVAAHFSTPLDYSSWVVELRSPDEAHPVLDAVPGDIVALPGNASIELLGPYRPSAGREGVRLWRSHLTGALPVHTYLRKHGRPISYGYLSARWPLAFYQTIFAHQPGSAEMPSAGRPFSFRLVAELASRGVGLAPIVLHAGVSSLESGEPPQPERFEVPERTAQSVNAARLLGGRVVAVGTTVARALETVARPSGQLRAGRGWSNLVLGPGRPARVIDGIITGWHEPRSSHLDLLAAVAGAGLVSAAQDSAMRNGYLGHEFGDSCLLLPYPGEREAGL